MSRRRREVDDDGRVQCGLCGEGVYIWNYYCLPVTEETPFSDIWWGDPTTLKQYGRPNSYCRACNRISQKGKEATHEWREVCIYRRRKRIDDPKAAYDEAHKSLEDDFKAETHRMMLKAMGIPLGPPD